MRRRAFEAEGQAGGQGSHWDGGTNVGEAVIGGEVQRGLELDVTRADFQQPTGDEDGAHGLSVAALRSIVQRRLVRVVGRVDICMGPARQRGDQVSMAVDAGDVDGGVEVPAGCDGVGIRAVVQQHQQMLAHVRLCRLAVQHLQGRRAVKQHSVGGPPRQISNSTL